MLTTTPVVIGEGESFSKVGNPLTLRREIDGKVATFWLADRADKQAISKWADKSRVFVVGIGDLHQVDRSKQPELIFGERP